MDKKNLYRNEIVKVYVTEEEKKRIKENMNSAKIGTMTNYIRVRFQFIKEHKMS